jgi:transposase
LALLLSARQGVQLMVANPRAARHFAKASMQRSKNDQLDALMLPQFVLRMEFQAWVRPEENTLVLWSIARRWQALTKQRAAEKNRQHAAGFREPSLPAYEEALRERCVFSSKNVSNYGRKRCSASPATPGCSGV